MNEKDGTIPKINEKKKKLIEEANFIIDNKWSIVKLEVLETKSLKKEKAYALNHFFNNYYLASLKNQNNFCYESKRGTSRIKYIYLSDDKKRNNTLYKYRMIFRGDKESKLASYSDFHSILANLVIDYPKVENESKLVTSIRENWMAIRKFGKDKLQTKLKLENCDFKYQRNYKEMLRHILVSDKDLPTCINVDSLRRINEDLTYTIEKK